MSTMDLACPWNSDLTTGLMSPGVEEAPAAAVVGAGTPAGPEDILVLLLLLLLLLPFVAVDLADAARANLAASFYVFSHLFCNCCICKQN